MQILSRRTFCLFLKILDTVVHVVLLVRFEDGGLEIALLVRITLELVWKLERAALVIFRRLLHSLQQRCVSSRQRFTSITELAAHAQR